MGINTAEREIGILQAKVSHLEKRIDELQAVVTINTNKLVMSSAEWNITTKWLNRSATVVGYVIFMGALYAGGKVTGVADLVLKVFAK